MADATSPTLPVTQTPLPDSTGSQHQVSEASDYGDDDEMALQIRPVAVLVDASQLVYVQQQFAATSAASPCSIFADHFDFAELGAGSFGAVVAASFRQGDGDKATVQRVAFKLHPVRSLVPDESVMAYMLHPANKVDATNHALALHQMRQSAVGAALRQHAQILGEVYIDQVFRSVFGHLNTYAAPVVMSNASQICRFDINMDKSLASSNNVDAVVKKAVVKLRDRVMQHDRISRTQLCTTGTAGGGSSSCDATAAATASGTLDDSTPCSMVLCVARMPAMAGTLERFLRELPRAHSSTGGGGGTQPSPNERAVVAQIVSIEVRNALAHLLCSLHVTGFVLMHSHNDAHVKNALFDRLPPLDSGSDNADNARFIRYFIAQETPFVLQLRNNVVFKWADFGLSYLEVPHGVFNDENNVQVISLGDNVFAPGACTEFAPSFDVQRLGWSVLSALHRFHHNVLELPLYHRSLLAVLLRMIMRTSELVDPRRGYFIEALQQHVAVDEIYSTTISYLSQAIRVASVVPPPAPESMKLADMDARQREIIRAAPDIMGIECTMPVGLRRVGDPVPFSVLRMPEMQELNFDTHVHFAALDPRLLECNLIGTRFQHLCTSTNSIAKVMHAFAPSMLSHMVLPHPTESAAGLAHATATTASGGGGGGGSLTRFAPATRTSRTSSTPHLSAMSTNAAAAVVFNAEETRFIEVLQSFYYMIINNTAFRHVLFNDTENNTQYTAMTIPPSSDIGAERHPHTTQRFCLLHGNAQMQLEDCMFPMTPGKLVVVTPGLLHDITNMSHNEPLLLLSSYNPPLHSITAHHQTKLDAMRAEQS